MKNHSKLGLFLSGMLASALLLSCAATAFAAAAGSVSFNAVNVSINRKKAIQAGEPLTDDAGCSVPSSILYTNEQGGGTTYLPVAALSRMLELPVTWDGGANTVGLGTYGPNEISISFEQDPPYEEPIPTCHPGAQAGIFTEIEPVDPREHHYLGTFLDMSFSTPLMGFGDTFYPSPRSERYISVMVTNRSDFPLRLSLSAKENFRSTDFPFSTVPAGETVTRTFAIGEYDGYFYEQGLSMSLRYDERMNNNERQPGDIQADVLVVDFRELS